MSNKMALDARGDIRKDMPSSAYKMGDEFKPFHPGASHVRPEWRDGWNACFIAAIAALQAEEVERLAAQAAPSSAIIASLCGDVEPVAEFGGRRLTPEGTTEFWGILLEPWDAPPKGSNLYSASTVAALKAERDALRARVAELEKDTARLEFVCNSPNRMVERENGLWRVYEDVAPTDRPTAVWQGITPRWHVTPREAIDAAITAALTKGQPAPQPQQEQP